MSKFEYCKPVNAKTVPTGPDWIHEVKYDGYRGRIVRDGKNVRLSELGPRLACRQCATVGAVKVVPNWYDRAFAAKPLVASRKSSL